MYMPEQTYIDISAIVIHGCYTYLALKIHFVLTKLFANFSRIDSYTMIHIFKLIHTPVQAYIYGLIQSYIL
jgi:hypothetical protein